MSEWIEFVESGTGETGFVRAERVAAIVPHRSRKTRVYVDGWDDPVTVDDTPLVLLARLTPTDTLCPLCGGTGTVTTVAGFVPCGTCDGSGRI